MDNAEFQALTARWRQRMKDLAADMDMVKAANGRAVPFDKGPLLDAFERSVKRLETGRVRALRK